MSEKPKQHEQQLPNYYDLVALRLEAAARLSRSLYTLECANVISGASKGSLLESALKVAENHWADICNGLIPVTNADTQSTMLVHDLPACVEAFRIVVMEHAHRNALAVECNKRMSDTGGFKLLTSTAPLQLQQKHECTGDCTHD